MIHARAFQAFLAKWRHLYALNAVTDCGYFTVDFNELSSDSDVVVALPDIVSEMRQSPELIINSFRLSLHQMLADEMLRDGIIVIIISGLFSSG